jgi:hypothetical protein
MTKHLALLAVQLDAKRTATITARDSRASDLHAAAEIAANPVSRRRQIDVARHASVESFATMGRAEPIAVVARLRLGRIGAPTHEALRDVAD